MGVCGLAHGARREEKKILHFPVTSGLSPSQPKQAKRIGKVPLLLKWRRRAPIPLPFFSLGAFRAGGKGREGNKGGGRFFCPLVRLFANSAAVPPPPRTWADFYCLLLLHSIEGQEGTPPKGKGTFKFILRSRPPGIQPTNLFTLFL